MFGNAGKLQDKELVSVKESQEELDEEELAELQHRLATELDIEAIPAARFEDPITRAIEGAQLVNVRGGRRELRIMAGDGDLGPALIALRGFHTYHR